MGIWVNPHPAAQLSDRDNAYVSCMNGIYRLMQSTCFPSQGGPFNVAAVNLQTLPGLGTNGSQVDSGYPSEFSFLSLFFVFVASLLWRVGLPDPYCTCCLAAGLALGEWKELLCLFSALLPSAFG